MSRGRHGLVDEDSLKDQLREQVDWRDFLETRLQAQRVTESGGELRHSCILPFGKHSRGDIHPSASFNIEKLKYNCYVCGGGDIFWLLQVVEGLTHDEAVRECQKLVHFVDKTGTQLSMEIEKLCRGEAPEEEESLPIFDSAVLEPWRVYISYLKKRGITLETAKKFQLGYNSDVDRLIIPHFFNGNLVGWQARKLPGAPKSSPKYLNSDDFPRQNTLYNFDQASQYRHIYLVEAPLSAVWMAQNGFPNVVASFGSKITKEQLALLSRFKSVTVFFDEDLAGFLGIRTVYNNLVGPGLFYVQHPNENDPFDCSPGVLKVHLDEHVEPLSLWRVDEDQLRRKVQHCLREA